MDIQCQHCGKGLKIPDEKIPKGKPLSVTCPACKQKISVTPSDSAANGNKPPHAVPSQEGNKEPEKNKAPAESEAHASSGSEESRPSENPFDFLEEGAKTAIICETNGDLRAQIKEVLQKLNYHILETQNPRDALKQLRYQVFDVIVINELFGTRDPEMNHVLKFLSQLFMVTRRRMFICLLTERFRTNDNMQSYNKSVNMVFNVRDMDGFGRMIELAIKDNDTFYKTYLDTFKRIKGL
jgi:CheY-like chemotaxis protein